MEAKILAKSQIAHAEIDSDDGDNSQIATLYARDDAYGSFQQALSKERNLQGSLLQLQKIIRVLVRGGRISCLRLIIVFINERSRIIVITAQSFLYLAARSTQFNYLFAG